MQDNYINNLNTEGQEDAVKETYVQVESQEARPAVLPYPESNETWSEEITEESRVYDQRQEQLPQETAESSQTFVYYDTSAPQEIAAQIPREWKSQAEQLYEANHWLPGGFWVRFFARMLDLAIEGVIGTCGFIASTNLFGDLASRPFFFDLPLGMCFWILFVLVYQTLMVKWTGATLGKMALRLNVVDLDTGGPLTWWQSFFRASFGKFLSDFTVVGNLLVLGKDHRSLNDRLSDTCVVYRSY